MKKIIFLGLIFLGLTAFAQQSEKKDTKSDEQAIRAISKNWLELTKKNDLAGCAALFAENGVVFRTNQEPVVGPAAIKKHFTEMHDKNPKADINWSTDRVEVAASGDLAAEYGNYNIKGLGPNGTETDLGRYITVYRKVNGAWKVSADIGSSTKPVTASK